MPILSVDEFAKLYRISRRHAYALVRRGTVQSVRLGRTVRVIVPSSWVPDAPRPEAKGEPRQPGEPRA